MTSEDVLYDALMDAGYRSYCMGAERRSNPLRTKLLREMWWAGWDEAMDDNGKTKEWGI